jgi:hypothetical protein
MATHNWQKRMIIPKKPSTVDMSTPFMPKAAKNSSGNSAIISFNVSASLAKLENSDI